MKKLLALAGSGFAYFCIGTVLAQGIGLLLLMQSGSLTPERRLRAVAALQGIETASVRTESKTQEESPEQESFEKIESRRTLASLDLDLRESAIDKSLGELKTIESRIKTERQRFDYLVDSFDKKLNELSAGASEAAVLETQRTIESLPPKQAKEQLLMLLDDQPSPGIDNPTEAVVSIVKAMSIERRRKILAEFKGAGEGDKLSAILKEILRGSPDVPLLREAREKLQNVMPDRK